MNKSLFGLAHLLVLAGWLLLGGPVAARANDAIDDELDVQVDQLLGYLEKQEYVHVGVLRFRAGVEGEPLSFRTGKINMSLANRLENWLLRHNDRDQKIRVLRDPGGEAAFRKEKATYLTPEGLGKLFGYKYPLLVETKEPVSPDAFVCGVAQLSKDRRKTKVYFEIVDRRLQLSEIPGLKFEVKTDPQILDDFAEPFALVSAGLHQMAPRAYRTLVVDTVSRNREAGGPPVDAEALVQLAIGYNGVEKKVVPHPTRPGALQVEEPGEKDEVALTLRNVSKQRVGVVLAVNGRNTLYQENVVETVGGPLRCTKWILDPSKEVTVMGFSQPNDTTYLPFRVLTKQEAGGSGEDLTTWPNLGAIDLHVFVAGDDRPQEIASKITVKGLRTPLARRGEPGLKSWDDVSRQIRSRNDLKEPRSKGPIAFDPREEKLRLETVQFPNPVEQEHRVIWYYEKAR
jgi:hypothetical protein